MKPIAYRFWLIAAVVLALAWTGLPGSADAQSSLDYGTLLGGSEEKPEPKQSRPTAGTGINTGTSTGEGNTSAPSADDYSRVAETATGDEMLSETRQTIRLFRERLRSMVQRMPEAWDKIVAALAAASPTGEPSYFIGVALFAGLLLMIGRAVTMVFMIYVSLRIMLSMQRAERHGYRGKLPVLAYRVIVTSLGVAITVGLAASIGLLFYQEHDKYKVPLMD